jgi:hypothetical protein
VNRVFLFLLLLALPVVGRVGEEYEAFTQRVGKPQETVRSPECDFVAVYRDYGREVALKVRDGLIRIEQYSPVEFSEVEAILEAQDLDIFAPGRSTKDGRSYFGTPRNKYYAVYYAREKALKVVESAQLEFEMKLRQSAPKGGLSATSASAPPTRPGTYLLRKQRVHEGGTRIAVEKARDFRSVPLAVGIITALFALLWVFQWISLLVHQSGHLIAAKMTGLRITEVWMGGSHFLRVARLRETKWYWHLNPFRGGWVVAESNGESISRTRRFCLAAGGPLATALFLALLVYLWIAFTPSSEVFNDLRPFGGRQYLAVIFLSLWIWQAIVLITVLAPVPCTMYGCADETDGLQLWNLLFRPASVPTRNVAGRLPRTLKGFLPHTAREIVKSGRLKTVPESARRAGHASPSEELAEFRLWLAGFLLKTGRIEAGRAAYRELFDGVESSHPRFAAAANGFATMALQVNARSLYAECESELRKALEAAPNAQGLEESLASLLADDGRDEEATPILRKWHRRSVCELSIGVSAAYLSTVAQRKGKVRESARYRRRALAFLAADHPVLKRLFPAEPIPAAQP